MKGKKSIWSREIRKAMIDKDDLSVTDLAELIGVSRQYCSGVVHGGKAAPEIAKKISEFLGVTVPYDVE